MNQFLTILDFSTGEVEQFDMSKQMLYKDYTLFDAEDFEDFLEGKGFKVKNIEYMVHSIGGIKIH